MSSTTTLKLDNVCSVMIAVEDKQIHLHVNGWGEGEVVSLSPAQALDIAALLKAKAESLL